MVIGRRTADIKINENKLVMGIRRRTVEIILEKK
jgi:hypothetical protein